MAANSNMGFHQGGIPSSAFNLHALTFQSGAINSSAGLIPSGSSSSGMMMLPCNSGVINNASGSSSSGLLLDNIPGLKHDTGLAVDWCPEEQSLLEEGLVKYGDEPNIMRYIKIAATLREKTVRDVALRCRWMTKKDNGKRRKPEEHYTGKKMKDRKEKLMDSSPKANIPPPFSQPNMVAYSFLMHHADHNDRLSSEVPALEGMTRHLLDKNAQFLSQITANLAAFKLQENIDLFWLTRNNITAILNDMREMPGIMSQMPPLPVSINEELASAIFPNTPQALMFGGPSSIASGSIQLKQEPRC